MPESDIVERCGLYLEGVMIETRVRDLHHLLRWVFRTGEGGQERVGVVVASVNFRF